MKSSETKNNPVELQDVEMLSDASGSPIAKQRGPQGLPFQKVFENKNQKTRNLH